MKSHLYQSETKKSPLFLLPSYQDDGEEVYSLSKKLSDKDFSLLIIYDFDWEKQRTPWPSPAISKNRGPFPGLADEYISYLSKSLIPEAMKKVSPSKVGILGYSLAGLFSLYSLYRLECFSLAASVSGSLWYPSFDQFIVSSQRKKTPDKVYLSVGDKEKKTSNPFLSQVEKKTKYVYEYYKSIGIPAFYELNDGNHFKDVSFRLAKAIAYLLK